jgi:hypothetical protein
MFSRKYFVWYLLVAAILPLVWALTGNAAWVLAFIVVVCILFMIFVMFVLGGMQGGDSGDGNNRSGDAGNHDTSDRTGSGST